MNYKQLLALEQDYDWGAIKSFSVILNGVIFDLEDGHINLNEGTITARRFHHYDYSTMIVYVDQISGVLLPEDLQKKEKALI